MKKALQMLLLGIAAFSETRAQTLQNPNIQNFGSAVNTSGTGQLVQNNLYDGSANISIPFYKTTIDGIPFSVTANYNTKGIRVDQVASRIGLGWDLTTGPVITREVHGLADEVYVPKYDCGGTMFDAYTGVWYSNTANTQSSNPSKADGELDKFTLYLNGRNIEFYFSRSGQLFTIPKSNIQINRILDDDTIGTVGAPLPYVSTVYGNISTVLPVNLKFRITDEAGNKYYFRRGDIHQEYIELPQGSTNPPTNYYLQKYYEVCDKWVVSRIVTNLGNTITYDYNQYNLNYNASKVENVAEYSIAGQQHIDLHSKNITYNGYTTGVSHITLPNNIGITFSDGIARCDLPGTNQLQSINIAADYGNTPNGGGILQPNDISYYLYYDYFKSDATNPNNYAEVPATGSCPAVDAQSLRLKLTSIKKGTTIGWNSMSLENYFSFDYVQQGLPPRLSAQQDLYGFYNNKALEQFNAYGTTFYTGVWEHSVPNCSYCNDYGINKDNDASAAAGYLIKKVKNALGGESEFFYNTYNSNQLQIISQPPYTQGYNATDGVTLSYQIDRDGISAENDVKTQYTYYSGQMFLPGGMPYINTAYDDNNPHIYVNTFFNNLLSTNLPVNGSNHGYDWINVAKYKNATNTKISSTDYYFSNAVNMNIASFPSSIANITFARKVNHNPTSGLGLNDNTLFSLTNLNGDGNFNKKYYQTPLTTKQYFTSWGMGLPVKIVNYDGNNKPLSATTNYYTVETDYINSSDVKNMHYMETEYSGGKATNWDQDVYYLMTGSANLTQSKEEQFVADNAALTTVTNYTYDSHNNVKNITSQNSLNESLQKTNYYPYDWQSYSSYAGPGINQLNQQGITTPIYSETWRTSGGTPRLINLNAVGYNVLGGKVLPTSVYNPMTTNGLSSVSYGSWPTGFNMNTAASGGTFSVFKKIKDITSYDAYNHVREIREPGNIYSTTIYNGKYGQAIATVSNAKYNEVAYTSFEGTYQNKGVADDSKGNWDFDPMQMETTISNSSYNFSGRIVYNLPAFNSNANITSTINLTPGKKYILTAWAKGGVPTFQNNGNNTWSQTLTTGRDGWTLYYTEMDGNGGPATITSYSSNIYVDEVRLYPYGSFMTTYTYEPLFGISSTCDQNNRMTIYEYDEHGNLSCTYDTEGNIIAKNVTVKQGND